MSWDPAEGERLKREGMDNAARGAPPSFKNNAAKALYWCAVRRPTLTTDDPRAMMLAWGNPKPPEGRAWGPIMQGAKRAGWIEWTPDTEKTANPGEHRRPKQVWRSLVYRGRR